MSIHSYSAGELDRLESRLDALVQAMVAFDAARLGVEAKFDFTPATIERARKDLSDFAEQLRAGLAGGVVQPEFVTLLQDIAKGSVPVSDWQADLAELPPLLLAGGPLTEHQLQALKNAIRFFRQEVAEKANRVRNR
jgi:hypothetical protein